MSSFSYSIAPQNPKTPEIGFFRECVGKSFINI